MYYSCESCKYHTKDISNYNKHIETKKHLRNSEFNELKEKVEELEDKTKEIEDKTKEIEDKTKEIEDKTKEIEEKTELKLNNAITKQRKFNKSIINLIEDKTKQIEDKTKQIEDKTKQIEDKTKQIEDKTELKLNNAIIKQRKFNKSVLTVLKEKFSNNPSLEKIDETDFIKELELEYECKINEKECKLQLLIIKDYKNKRLIDTICKIILKFIKKEELSLQSIFNTDCSRGNYATKLETTWLNDKFGMKFRDIILSPIIEYIINALEPLRNKIVKLSELNRKSPSMDKSDFIMENSNSLLELNCMLVKKKTYEQIIYKLSPQLQLEFNLF
jgi:DNA repair exonuclease SbcCD ATPase subunit